MQKKKKNENERTGNTKRSDRQPQSTYLYNATFIPFCDFTCKRKVYGFPSLPMPDFNAILGATDGQSVLWHGVRF
jgi:hypothetical protein